MLSASFSFRLGTKCCPFSLQLGLARLLFFRGLRLLCFQGRLLAALGWSLRWRSFRRWSLSFCTALLLRSSCAGKRSCATTVGLWKAE